MTSVRLTDLETICRNFYFFPFLEKIHIGGVFPLGIHGEFSEYPPRILITTQI